MNNSISTDTKLYIMNKNYDIIFSGNLNQVNEFTKLELSESNSYDEVVHKIHSKKEFENSKIAVLDLTSTGSKVNMQELLEDISVILLSDNSKTSGKSILKLIEDKVLRSELTWQQLDQIVIHILQNIYEIDLSDILQNYDRLVQSDIFAPSVLVRTTILSGILSDYVDSVDQISYNSEFDRNNLVKLLSHFIDPEIMKSYNEYLKLQNNPSKVN